MGLSYTLTQSLHLVLKGKEYIFKNADVYIYKAFEVVVKHHNISVREDSHFKRWGS